ncbi:hypothetical protein [Pseudescherichia vulneris]|uniref:hypothetical protein n=1 Tax=Pseudescherichia vulneris TaxID=566 RepID=UPI0028B0A76C|nr:hypothetical protein [Pseudescherichia vulneris]
MLLGDYDRYAVECEMELARTPKDAPTMPVSDTLKAVENLYKSGKAIYSIAGGKSTVRIIDMLRNEAEGHTIILFQYANANASDPHFANKLTGTSRKANRSQDEAPAVTSHICIRHTPRDRHLFPDFYKTLVEEVPGLTKSLMASALTWMIAESTDYSFTRNDGKKPRDIKCRPIVSINPYASRTLKESLATGALLGITAVRYKNNKKLDDDGEISIVQETMVMSFKSTSGQKAINILKKASDIARRMEYSDLKLTRKDKNKRVVSDEIDVSYEKSIEDIADTIFAEKEKIILSAKIEICETKIHKELAGKMSKLLLK